MILAMDIGNTNIVIGGFERDRLVFRTSLSADINRTEDEYATLLLGVLSLYGVERDRIRGAIIASVVPPLNTVVRKAVAFLCGIEALIVGPGIRTGINIHCDIPSSVGADIICACVAAHTLYGSPSLVIDMGTATKMMVMSRNGAFVGVSIIPGVQTGLDALVEKTAQLPKVSLEAPRSVIGKNTADCMKSGVVFGNASLVDGMIDRIREELGEEIPVYATGGFAPMVIGYCRHRIRVDEHLVLKGLYIIYKKNNEK
ncbi:MAG: type III pantothenate kinase [Clostridia bacterium]|nr:type III pantothenate kinase [Clostridia bacterium]